MCASSRRPKPHHRFYYTIRSGQSSVSADPPAEVSRHPVAIECFPAMSLVRMMVSVCHSPVQSCTLTGSLGPPQTLTLSVPSPLLQNSHLGWFGAVVDRGPKVYRDWLARPLGIGSESVRLARWVISALHHGPWGLDWIMVGMLCTLLPPCVYSPEPFVESIKITQWFWPLWPFLLLLSLLSFTHQHPR